MNRRVNRSRPSSHMDTNLCSAAQTGNMKELYTLIQRNGNVLREIDEIEFTDSPLHIAAAKGCIDFAMEIMSLKPSFARKLNQDGLSPMHLAVMKGHTEIALRLLEIDGGLVRVRGKKGKTPLHHICKQGNPNGLLEKFLETCPERIGDVTIKNQTALHVAVEKENLDVVKVLLQALRNSEHQEVVNRKDQDGDTALHIAARKNQSRIVKLLLTCKADKNATNLAGLTAKQVAEQLGNRECLGILLDSFILGFTPCLHMLQKGIHKCTKRASKVIFQGMDNISSNDRNALLVILALLLTAAFQTSVSPPGGVWQDNSPSSSNSTSTELNDYHEVGKSVMSEFDFLRFYLPTCAVFMVSIFLTLSLLKPYPHGFKTALQLLLIILAICFDGSFTITAPTNKARDVIHTFSFLLFILMVFMCYAYRVSTISVFILGCWLLPAPFGYKPFTFTLSVILNLISNIILGFWLFHFICHEWKKGVFLIIAYCIIPIWGSGETPGNILGPIIVVRSCCFIKLCQFYIKRYNARRYK